MRWIAPLVLCGRSLLSHNNPFRSGGHGLARAFSTGGLPLRSLRFRTTTTTNPATTIAAFLLSASSSSSSSEGGSPPIRRDRSTMISAAATTASAANPGTGYLNAADAAALDEDLMSTPGFSLEQLMELAGLAVAEAVYECVPPSPSREDGSATAPKKVVFVCGPGNNGGDGLVAARHLSFFGRYDISVVYPKRSTKRRHFVDLVKQCEDVGIPVLDELPEDLEDCDALVDAIFGFSFRGEPREPFGTILRRLKEAREKKKEKEEGDHRRRRRTLVLSVDVPSGWNVDEGDSAGTGFVPDVLVSLTAPKLCSKGFGGRHFVGGRFLPPAVASKYDVRMPPYPGVSQVMEVTREHIEGGSKTTATTTTTTTTTPEKGSASASAAEDDDDGSWRAEYAAYLAEKEREANANADETSSPPSAAADGDDDDRKESVDDESWQEQYAAYCIEKEARLAEEDAKQREALRKEPK